MPLYLVTPDNHAFFKEFLNMYPSFEKCLNHHQWRHPSWTTLQTFHNLLEIMRIQIAFSRSSCSSILSHQCDEGDEETVPYKRYSYSQLELKQLRKLQEQCGEWEWITFCPISAKERFKLSKPGDFYYI